MYTSTPQPTQLKKFLTQADLDALKINALVYLERKGEKLTYHLMRVIKITNTRLITVRGGGLGDIRFRRDGSLSRLRQRTAQDHSFIHPGWIKHISNGNRTDFIQSVIVDEDDREEWMESLNNVFVS